MAIPSAVKKQADKADELLKQSQTNADKTQAVKDETLPPGEKTTTPPPVQQETTPPVQHQSPQPQSDPAKQQQTDWKARYHSLQGKYDAEVPRLNHENSQLRNEMNELRSKVQELQSQVQSQPEPQPQAEELPDNIKELLKEYDELEPLIDWVLKNRNQAQPTPNNTDDLKEIKGRLENVEQMEHRTATQRYFHLLKELCPDWETINNDPQFVAWLGEVESFTGKVRHDLLTDAHNDLDAKRVSVFFNTWKAENGAKSQKQETTLESKLQPENNRSGGEVPQKTTYTRSQIKQFYVDLQKGKYRHNPEEAQRIDRDIIAAQAEGRIVG